MTDHLEEPPFDRPVDERGGGDLVEAAGRPGVGGDPVVVAMADEPGDHTGVAVDDIEQGVGVSARRVVTSPVDERRCAVVAGHDHELVAVVGEGELFVEPVELSRTDAALVVARRVVGVEDHHGEPPEVDHGVGRRRDRPVPACGATTSVLVDPLDEVDGATKRVGSYQAGCRCEEPCWSVDEQRQCVVRGEAVDREQALLRADRCGDEQLVDQGCPLAQKVVVAGQAGPGHTDTE